MGLADRTRFPDYRQLRMRLETFPQVGPSIGLIIDDQTTERGFHRADVRGKVSVMRTAAGRDSCK